MIPLKLSLRNFLSYRENVPPLDFEGVHVACLCGDNGHGKSALLDAITWCLWGKARGQVQDDLVSYGAEEARVELDFMARDGRYRAIRSRRRASGRRRQGASDLQLQAMNGDGAFSQVVTGNSLRETQARIEQLVGMDYETFINSAFLLQGRADEFTNKTPADRKAVLASILGLEAYDRFQSRARERVGEKRSETDRLDGELGRIQTEIELIGKPAPELDETNRLLAEIGARLSESRKLAEDLRATVGALRSLDAQLTEHRKLSNQLQRDIVQAESTISAITGRIKEHEALINQSEDINSGIKQLEAAQARFAVLEASRQEYETLRQEQNDLTRFIEIERTRVESDVEQLNRRIAGEFAPLSEAEPTLLDELGTIRKELTVLAEVEKSLAEITGRIQSLATGIGEAQTLAARYQAEGEQLNEKLHLLKNTIQNTVVCPLCLSPLSEDGCQRLADNYEAEITEKREFYRGNRTRLQSLEEQKTGLEADLVLQEQSYSRELNRLREQGTRTETQLQASREAKVELGRAKDRLTELAAILDSGKFAQDANSRLHSVAEAMLSLAFEEDTYRQTIQAMRQLESFGQLKLQLDRALRELPQERTELQNGAVMLQRKLEELENLRGQIQQSETAIAELPEIEGRLAQVSQQESQLERDQQSTLSHKGLLEGKLQRLEELSQALEHNRGRLSALQDEYGIYQELVSAFGRQGIQAMLIETVVPRLEEETNVLLGRMTDNRMHVKLETQRERRSGLGEPIETLEINVSDELGSRSYEMYSGGETFRVNLALRIALSRVLSQRTGAPLPTLFIDEGFGTQDASGRERILDVISAIEDDFDKIIVITHLDDLKDMFPVRIEVQKDANGSTFWLS